MSTRPRPGEAPSMKGAVVSLPASTGTAEVPAFDSHEAITGSPGLSLVNLQTLIGGAVPGLGFQTSGSGRGQKKTKKKEKKKKNAFACGCHFFCAFFFRAGHQRRRGSRETRGASGSLGGAGRTCGLRRQCGAIWPVSRHFRLDPCFFRCTTPGALARVKWVQ